MVINPFYSLLIVALIAFFIPFLAKRLGIPVIVGEISFGILVGILNVFIRDHWNVVIISFEEGTGLDLLAEIGLIFLLFLAGLEIDINVIDERGIRAVLFAPQAHKLHDRYLAWTAANVCSVVATSAWLFPSSCLRISSASSSSSRDGSSSPRFM